MKKQWLFFSFLLLSMGSVFADSCNAPPVLVPEASPKAMSFYHSGNILWIIQQVWSLAIPAIILFTGWGARLRNVCEKITRIWFWKTALFTLFFLIIVALLTLPLEFYAGYIRLHDYSLSHQSIGRWFYQYLLGTGISTGTGIILVWILYGIIRVSPKRWWLYFGLLNFPLVVILIFVQPIWIAPLFNTFGPMKNKELEHKILDLANRAGIEGSRVYEVDMSADTSRVNAYVTGIGSSKRIVIWDTAISELTEDELLFVVGHEMGHYVLHHMWWGILVYTLITLFVLWLVYLASLFFRKKCSRKMGFSDMKDIASLPLVLLLYMFFSLALTPLDYLFSRTLEHNADTFGLELTHLNHAAGTGFVTLTNKNLANPWPGDLYIIFRASHPTIGKRITYFNEYKPWCYGLPLKYGKFFRKDSEVGS
ncbi:MAG: M48 family metallopeptidase [Chlamydiia bacterium]|nr:M48 family metallopeptidase [Chlamydiia bacterium]